MKCVWEAHIWGKGRAVIAERHAVFVEVLFRALVLALGVAFVPFVLALTIPVVNYFGF